MNATRRNTDPALDAAPAVEDVAPARLLRERRFAPFFWVQFSGALNDNLFKVGFTSVVTYQAALYGVANPRDAAFLIGAIFVLPFLLFSATAGQLADKYDKAALMRWVKTLEIGIMVLASAGFLMHDARILYAGIFFMGLHSTVFGPAKYAYLPEQLQPSELVRGNGLVEMGTFVSILLGTLIGGMVAAQVAGGVMVAVLCLSCALAGRVCAAWIPSAPAAAPQLIMNWNPFGETLRNIRIAAQDRIVFMGLIGISWLWFVGALLLTSFFSFARDILHAGPSVVTLMLGVFTVGVGIGALLCGQLQGAQRALGLVPLGSLGMSVFAFDLYWSSHALAGHVPPLSGGALYGIGAFLSHGAHWRILCDLALLAITGGLYSVPLYALIQHRSAPTHRARIIAANNILNALFMIASSLMAMALGALGAPLPVLFLAVAVLNALVLALLCGSVPAFLTQTRLLIRR